MYKWFKLLQFILVFRTDIFATDMLSPSKSQFGELVSEDTLTFTGLKQFEIINDLLVLYIEDENSKSYEVNLYDPVTLKLVRSIPGPCDNYNLSTDNPKSIIVDEWEDETVKKTRVFDVQLGLLFDLESPNVHLAASPSSSFFFSQYDEFLSDTLVIYDRGGKKLLENPNELKLGYSFAYNDSILVIARNNKISFMSVPSGNILNAIEIAPSSIQGAQGLAFMGGDRFVLTVLTWQKDSLAENLCLIDSALTISWSNSNFLGITGFDLSDDEKLLALTSRSIYGSFLTLIETATGKSLWTESLEAELYRNLPDYPQVEFTDSFIQIFGTKYQWWGQLDSTSSTFILSIDIGTGSILEKSEIPGVVSIFYEKSSIRTFSVISQNREQIIVSDWQPSDQ